MSTWTQDSYRDELYHHGIKGQKWGVRRYQNKDGSYTAAGKKRYLTNGMVPEIGGGGGGGEMTEEERKKLEDLQKKLSLTNRKRMAEVREADRERGTPLERKTETYTPYYFPRLNPGDYGPAADGLRGVTGRQAARRYRNLIRDDWNNLSPEDKTTYDKHLVGVEKSTEQGVPVYEIRKNVRPNYPMLSPHNLKTKSKELTGRSREINDKDHYQELARNSANVLQSYFSSKASDLVKNTVAKAKGAQVVKRLNADATQLKKILDGPLTQKIRSTSNMVDWHANLTSNGRTAGYAARRAASGGHHYDYNATVRDTGNVKNYIDRFDMEADARRREQLQRKRKNQR